MYSEKHSETIFPHLADELRNIVHRKPDIHIVNELAKRCTIIEITVCYDLYLDTAAAAKVQRYQMLVDYLIRNGYSVNLYVLCFGSLGSVHSDVWKYMRRFTTNITSIKGVLKWCSISNIIGSNYIWRNRVRKVTAEHI